MKAHPKYYYLNNTDYSLKSLCNLKQMETYPSIQLIIFLPDKQHKGGMLF